MRPSNAILGANVGAARGVQSSMLDLRYGGTHGFAVDYSQIASATDYVQQHLICIVLDAPRLFRLVPGEQDYWIGTLRALFELHAISIEGVTGSYEITSEDSSPVGGAGEMMNSVTNITRAQTKPRFRFPEKAGMPVSRFFRGWSDTFIMDPETKVPRLASLGIQIPELQLIDDIGATVMFIEPDVYHQKVVKAFLSCGVRPTGTLEWEARKDKTTSKELKTYDVEFDAITQHGLGVDALAQVLLSNMSLLNADPQTRQAFLTDINADVSRLSEGYQPGITNLANSAVGV